MFCMGQKVSKARSNATSNYDSSLFSSSQYHGELKSGWRHGFGTYLFENGDVYSGNWESGIREGWGVFLVACEGAKYEGQWRNGVRHGLGTLTFGRQFQGGNLLGSKFFGQFQDDRLHGLGVCISKSGDVVRQIWDSGKLMSTENFNCTSLSTRSSSSDSPVSHRQLPFMSWSAAIVAELAEAAGIGALIDPIVKRDLNARKLVKLDFGSLSGIEKDRAEWRVLALLARTLRRTRMREISEQIVADSGEADVERVDFEKEVKLTRKIASGGFGAVYKARWKHMDVAVKICTGANFGELEALSRIRHPNVVLMLGRLESPSKRGLVFEYIPCGTLFDLLHKHKHKLSVNRCIHLGKDVASGLAYIHAIGFWHCDVKSSNVLLTGSWRAKLADLGLACHARALAAREGVDEFRLAEAGAEGLEVTLPLGIVGTFHWTAPEVLRGEDFSELADVYSLGCVCWEAVTSEIPHGQFTALQTLALVGYGGRRLEPVGEPKKVGQLLAQVTANSPGERPKASEVARRLGEMANLHLEDSLERFFTFSLQ